MLECLTRLYVFFLSPLGVKPLKKHRKTSDYLDETPAPAHLGPRRSPSVSVSHDY